MPVKLIITIPEILAVMVQARSSLSLMQDVCRKAKLERLAPDLTKKLRKWHNDRCEDISFAPREGRPAIDSLIVDLERSEEAHKLLLEVYLDPGVMGARVEKNALDEDLHRTLRSYMDDRP